MKAAYVGILEPGSTSRMRAECLRRLTPSLEWEWMDTAAPMRESARIWRTLAFRYQQGKAVDRINELVLEHVSSEPWDLVWIDKGVFLRGSTMRAIRRQTKRLVHFTPDTAFHSNRSRHFEESLELFDLAVTTKSFEAQEYHRRIGSERTLIATQGYEKLIHFPRGTATGRKRGVVFIGLAEPDRESCLATLLARDIPVSLAGHGWNAFRRRWRGNRLLTFEGEGVFGDAYAQTLSSSWIGLGLLSKRFPELHTTRTFEIPACGAVLATERNHETTRYFDEGEALFFDDYEDLATQIRVLLAVPGARLAEMAVAGMRRVRSDSRDYDSILASILADDRLSL